MPTLAIFNRQFYHNVHRAPSGKDELDSSMAHGLLRSVPFHPDSEIIMVRAGRTTD